LWKEEAPEPNGPEACGIILPPWSGYPLPGCGQRASGYDRLAERRFEFVPSWQIAVYFVYGKFLDQWCARTRRSQLEPMKKVARTLRNHRELLLNWFRAKGAFLSGVVEGFNCKVKLTTRKSYGFRTYEAIEIALYHNLGALPEPDFTHRFW